MSRNGKFSSSKHGKREDLAWAAGFFDGEGCTYLGRLNRSGTRFAAASISQTEPSTLQRFRTALGLGTVAGPYGPHPGDKCRSPMWSWRVNSFEETQASIAMLWCWLSTPKRAQAKRILALSDVGISKIRTCQMSGHSVRLVGAKLRCRTCENEAWRRRHVLRLKAV